MDVKALLVVILFLVLASSAFSSVTLRQGEAYSVGDKEIIVENIRPDKAVIGVGGVKSIISVGEQKEVNGIDILVEGVFYVDQPEERTVIVVMSVAFYCGDGNCDTGQNETKENCCKDCGCNSGYVCSDNVCKSEAQVKKEQEEEEEKNEDKCSSNADCDDNNPFTEDICKSTAGKPKKCLNIPPICKTDLECDDQDPCTVDRCVNQDCFNTEVPDYDACLEKQEVTETGEKKEVAPEIVQDSGKETELEGFIKEEKNLFSKVLDFFLGLF
ncbi:MAG: hypothetical protein Q8N77_02575 [Nanoarchaeota archaeon]|nr:hypothetical protein [Nanoarchaeota archaeon]